jgi:hypothetical protein
MSKEQKVKDTSRPRKSLGFYAKVAATFWRQRRFGVISDPVYDVGLKLNRDFHALDQRAAEMPVRKVLIAGVQVPARSNDLDNLFAELGKTRHNVTFLRAPMGDRGKFDNIQLALENVALNDFDWLVIVDDDVKLQPHFLDHFLYLSEQAGLVLSQPAHKIYSYKIWRLTRRTWSCLARRTGFVECGPITAFHQSILRDVVPFPPSRFGWGLDYLWARAAERRGLAIGIVDATPIQHTRPVAGSYNWGAAESEMNKLLQAHNINLENGGFMVDKAKLHTLKQMAALSGKP